MTAANFPSIYCCTFYFTSFIESCKKQNKKTQTTSPPDLRILKLFTSYIRMLQQHIPTKNYLHKAVL